MIDKGVHVISKFKKTFSRQNFFKKKGETSLGFETMKNETKGVYPGGYSHFGVRNTK
jgi:hypothetical protein